MAAYYLPTTLVLYAANAMYTSQFDDKSDRFFLSCVLIILLFLTTTSVSAQTGELFSNMRAYSFRDRPRVGYNFLMWLVLLGWVDWKWALISVSNWAGRLQLVWYMSVYFGMLLLIILFDHASESALDWQTKAVADYMKQLKSSKSSTSSPSTSTSTSPFFDDDANSSVQLDYCRYPFVEREDGNWVALKELFHQCGDLPTKDKDICLSYSLCRLLARRYYGFHCAEEGDDKVRRFALFQNLLASYWRPIHTAFRKINSLPEGSTPTTRGFLRGFLFSGSRNPNAQEVLIDPFQTETDGAYWRNKIGQYSIIQDYDRGRSPKKALEDWFHRIMLSQPSYWFIKHLPVEEEAVDMKKLDSMRELVADTLWAIDGPPTNGTRSPKINMGSSGYDWSWTCRTKTHTHTILIWHIATCYCGMTPPHSYRHNGLRLLEIDTWYEVATALSRYCAYLVAFLPEFLPDHILTTKCHSGCTECTRIDAYGREGEAYEDPGAMATAQAWANNLPQGYHARTATREAQHPSAVEGHGRVLGGDNPVRRAVRQRGGTH